MDLRLVPLAERHLEIVRAWRMSEDVSRWMFTDPVITPEGQREWFRARVQGDASSRWWILEGGGVPIGLANVTQIDPVNRRCEWGYYIGQAAHRGQGIGTRLARTVHDHVFDVLGMQRLVTEVLASNEAGLALPAKTGCVREGTLRGHVFKRGTYHDVVVFGLLADEWRRFRGGLDAAPIPIEVAPALTGERGSAGRGS
jgi:UDP-4-amino-4,6-dideoxy-N-acetyl-beta-L-altrosamine N-acetyltransferase